MRRETIAVRIGEVVLSSGQPILVQSMLNTSTLDTEACVQQAIRIIEAGGQLVRITAPGLKEAENLKNIRDILRERSDAVPISADIHFSPAAALVAARYVEKVRINPGNFVDKRATFQHLVYTEEEYAAELGLLKRKFTEFLDECRRYQTAVRIGTNHGSLSDRIMSRYGNTPAGMVEATMEYLRICQETGFDNVVISLKSSDCRIMVEAVRLLVREMEKAGMKYPLHLGVTEAGEGEDGRIRSAVGIGCLLNEGIGDTIRVSLTEAPEREIPVARTLIDVCRPLYQPARVYSTGRCTKPVLVADISASEVVDEKIIRQLNFYENKEIDPALGIRLGAGTKTPEMIYTEALGPELTKLPSAMRIIVPYRNLDMAHVYHRGACPLVSRDEFMQRNLSELEGAIFVKIVKKEEINGEFTEQLRKTESVFIVLALALPDYHLWREMYSLLRQAGVKHEIILKTAIKTVDRERAALQIAAHTGGLFIDRLPYGLWIAASKEEDIAFTLNLGRNILQSVGLRRYKTEFISCPGCGRTLYNLEEAVAKVKEAFSHLDKLKIAIMGCVVNGPGEMGDADYGYVGAGNGKVNLYKGRQMVRTAIPEQEAIVALEQLIRENGDWCTKGADEIDIQ